MITKIAAAALISVAFISGCTVKAADAPHPAPTVTVTKSADPIPAPEPPPSVETQYISALRSMNNPLVDAATNDQLLDMGYSVCDAFATGASVDDVVSYMADQMTANGHTSDYELQFVGYIIAAADKILCPSAGI